MYLTIQLKTQAIPKKAEVKMEWPFTVIPVTPFRAVTLEGKLGTEFKVNGQRLKHYMG